MDIKGVICYTCYLLTVFSVAVGMYQSKEFFLLLWLVQNVLKLFSSPPGSRRKFLSRKLRCGCTPLAILHRLRHCCRVVEVSSH